MFNNYCFVVLRNYNALYVDFTTFWKICRGVPFMFESMIHVYVCYLSFPAHYIRLNKSQNANKHHLHVTIDNSAWKQYITEEQERSPIKVLPTKALWVKHFHVFLHDFINDMGNMQHWGLDGEFLYSLSLVVANGATNNCQIREAHKFKLICMRVSNAC